MFKIDNLTRLRDMPDAAVEAFGFVCDRKRNDSNPALNPQNGILGLYKPSPPARTQHCVRV
jgi:hypothetical protein